MRSWIIIIVGLLLFAGMPNGLVSADFQGNVLHVYSHDTESGYEEQKNLDYVRINSANSFTVKWDLVVTNYEGGTDYDSDGVVLMEIGLENIGIFEIRYFGNSIVYVGKTDGSGEYIELDATQIHNYKATITYRGSTGLVLTFYVDDEPIWQERISNSQFRGEVILLAGRRNINTVYDLYLDNINLSYSGGIIEEDFEDESDDFFTDDWNEGEGESGEEIIESTSVPEFPFLIEIFEFLKSTVRM